jgi:hypothetical protein
MPLAVTPKAGVVERRTPVRSTQLRLVDRGRVDGGR